MFFGVGKGGQASTTLGQFSRFVKGDVAIACATSVVVPFDQGQQLLQRIIV